MGSKFSNKKLFALVVVVAILVGVLFFTPSGTTTTMVSNGGNGYDVLASRPNRVVDDGASTSSEPKGLSKPKVITKFEARRPQASGGDKQKSSKRKGEKAVPSTTTNAPTDTTTSTTTTSAVVESTVPALEESSTMPPPTTTPTKETTTKRPVIKTTKEGATVGEDVATTSVATHSGDIDVVTAPPLERGEIIQFETYEYPRFEGEGFVQGTFGHGALDAVFCLKDYKNNPHVFGQPAPPTTPSEVSSEQYQQQETNSSASPNGNATEEQHESTKAKSTTINDDGAGSGDGAGATTAAHSESAETPSPKKHGAKSGASKHVTDDAADADGNNNGADAGYTPGPPPPPTTPDKFSAGERAKQLISLSAKQRSTIDHAPLYPDKLEDYRHTYGNCHSKIKRLTPEERSELGTGIVSPELFERVYKKFTPSNGLFGGGTEGSGGYSNNNNKLPPYDYTSELPIMYSNITVGKGSRLTRLWPQYPDRRMQFPTEHERCHAVMIRQLAILAAVLKKGNLTRWFITHATLLGGVRHGGFIPWDVDIDVVMPNSHIKYLRKFWRSEFPRDMFLQTERTDRNFLMMNGKERAIRTKDRYSGFFGYDWVGFRRKKRVAVKRFNFGAGIDIVPLEKTKGGLYRILGNYIAKEDIYPLTEVCFENMMVPAPRNVTRFLERLYGSKWYQVPPQSAEFGGATFLNCVTTTPVHGSPWNLNWTHDHPGAANGSHVYPDYHPFEGVHDVYATFNTTNYTDPEPRLEEYSETIPPATSPPPGSTQKKKHRVKVEDRGGVGEGGGDGDDDGKTTKPAGNGDLDIGRDEGAAIGAVPTRMAIRKHYAVQRVGTHRTKMFPRADPHGTIQSDFRTPFMKFVGLDLKPKYADQPIPDDEKDAEDVAHNGAFIGVG